MLFSGSLEYLSWSMQDARKSQNQDLRAEPAWNIDLGKRIHARDFPGLRRLTAAANSSCLKGSEMLWPSGVAIFHRSDSFLLISLEDPRPRSWKILACLLDIWCVQRWQFSEGFICKKTKALPIGHAKVSTLHRIAAGGNLEQGRTQRGWGWLPTWAWHVAKTSLSAQ